MHGQNMSRKELHFVTDFEELYKDSFVPVYRYAYARLGHREAAEDIAQIVFTKAWEKRDRYEERGKPALAYLFTIARNAIIDRQRRKEPIVMDDAQLARLEIPDDQDPTTTAQQSENVRSIHAALAELSEEQRDVVLLRYISELSYTEISKITGKSEEALRKTVSRAIHELQRRKH